MHVLGASELSEKTLLLCLLVMLAIWENIIIILAGFLNTIRAQTHGERWTVSSCTYKVTINYIIGYQISQVSNCDDLHYLLSPEQALQPGLPSSEDLSTFCRHSSDRLRSITCFIICEILQIKNLVFIRRKMYLWCSETWNQTMVNHVS